VNLTTWIRGLFGGGPAEEQRFSMDDYASWMNSFGYNGNTYGFTGIRQTLTGDNVEPATNDYLGLAAQSFGANAIVFACMALRQHVFSSTRFQWQNMIDGRPSKLFGTKALALLETPWVGGTTQDLLSRMIQDADLAGNSYQFVDTPLSRIGGDGGQELVRMRPDWVDVAMEPRMVRGRQVGWRKTGYIYSEGGYGQGEPVAFGVDEVAHFAPIPDPLARHRGMSWLTPVIREVQADHLMTVHKRKFFENGATVNMIIKYPETVQKGRILEFKALMDAENAGVENAYKRLHLGGGADATVVGSDFQSMTFKEVQGAGETRIAAAAGTPPVLVGLSEGLQGSSLNEGNYAMARRRMADATMHPLWQNVSGSLATVTGSKPPGNTRLWYDTRDVPFLREDEKDAAEIAQLEAATMRSLIDAGYTPDSVSAAMLAGDWGLLAHSGLFSVQLQTPGSGQPAPGSIPALNGSGTTKLPVGK
jgi:phage portal protein BeeE